MGGEDYGFSGKRKNKNDKRAKMRYNKYKRGGHWRAQNVNIQGKSEEGQRGN